MKTFIFLISGLILSSCSNPLGDGPSVVDSNYGTEPNRKVKPLTGFEAVSAAILMKNTSSNTHKVDVAVGVATTPMKLQTTNKKTVFLSVQGQINSN